MCKAAQEFQSASINQNQNQHAVKKAALLFPLLFLIAFQLSGQNHPNCNTQFIELDTSCANSCVVCDQQTLTGHNYNVFGNPGFPLYPDCQIGNNYIVNNPGYFTYVATDFAIEVILTTSNCISGEGLQLFIYEDCINVFNPTPVACIPDLVNGPNSVNVGGLFPGKSYSFLIDGFNDDQCEFTLQINPQNNLFTVPQPQPLDPQEIQTPGFPLCPDQALEFTLPGMTGVGFVKVSNSSGVIIRQDGPDGPPTDMLSTLPGVPTSFWASVPTGIHQITFETGNDCYPDGVSSVFTVVADTARPVTTLPNDTITFGQLPFINPLTFEVIYDPGVHYFSNTFTGSDGCDSIVEQTYFVLTPFVSGTVFVDNNFNGQFDAGDELYEGAPIFTPSGGITFSNSDGFFSYNQVDFFDTISIFTPMGFTAVPDFHVYNGAPGPFLFALQPSTNAFDLAVDLTNTQVFRQGFDTELLLTVSNLQNTMAPNSQAKILLPHYLDYLSAIPAPDQIQGDTLCWNIGNLNGQSSVAISILTQTLLGTPNNTPIKVNAWALPVIDDFDPDNNQYLLESTVVGSYDPNDKQVNPPLITPELIESGELLEYTIRFQNTGNYLATYVRLIDTLSDRLDPGGLRFISSSHPCSWKLKPGNVLDVFFDTINLPDSTSNEPESHGFVKFAIPAANTLGFGDQIENFCDIYFDFNQPIRTNTVGTQVVPFIPDDGFPLPNDILEVRPNPGSYLQQFTWFTPAPTQGRLYFFDILGQARLDLPVQQGDQMVLADVSQLPQGSYYVLLESGMLQLTRLVLIHRGGLPFGLD